VPKELDALVYSYTGDRLVLYQWGNYRTNLARIRWRNIYKHIPGDAERVADNRVLTTGRPDRSTGEAVAARYGVDVVVARGRASGAPGFAGLKPTPASAAGE